MLLLYSQCCCYTINATVILSVLLLYSQCWCYTLNAAVILSMLSTTWHAKCVWRQHYRMITFGKPVSKQHCPYFYSLNGGTDTKTNETGGGKKDQFVWKSPSGISIICYFILFTCENWEIVRALMNIVNQATRYISSLLDLMSSDLIKSKFNYF